MTQATITNKYQYQKNMNIKTNTKTCTIFGAFLLSVLFQNMVNAAFQQPKLRGSNANLEDNSQNQSEREMEGNGKCAGLFPVNGSSCADILTGNQNFQECWWRNNRWDGYGNTITEENHCVCTKKLGMIWDCSKKTTGTTTPPGTSKDATNRPTTRPNPPRTIHPTQISTLPPRAEGSSDNEEWCPKFTPNTNTICALPSGKSYGDCNYWEALGTYENGNGSSTDCSCTSDSRLFVCQVSYFAGF